MGLFGFGKKKQEREYLLKWQNAVLDTPCDKLITTRDELTRITNDAMRNAIRIITDSASLMESTLKPDVFFTRLNLMLDVTSKSLKYEPYCKMESFSISEFHMKVEENYQEYVRLFILRCFSDTYEKAAAMKTCRGQINKWNNWYESLKEYYPFMSDENIFFVESEYKLQTKSIAKPTNEKVIRK